MAQVGIHVAGQGVFLDRDAVCIKIAGGYGVARQRDPAKTLKDVRDGYVSAAAARETYNLDQDAE